MQAKFDHTASGYDAEFSHTEVGRRQRAQTWAWLDKHLPQNGRISLLELNCGTGEDAKWLVNRGIKVTATDFSAEMVETTRQKLAENEAELLVSSIQSLKSTLQGRQFDWVWSNFGGLNCLSPQEMNGFAADMRAFLPKGGKLAVVVMGRFCLWESLYFIAKFKFGKAFRRFGRAAVKARLADGVFQDTWYFGPKETAKIMGPEFQCISQVPIGIALPPSYLDPFFAKRPKFLQKMTKWEQRLQNKAWAAHFSDHFLLAFERK